MERKQVRVQYVKYERGSRKYVIVDQNEHGELRFADQEVGSGEWYPYTPSPAEERQALRLVAEGRGASGWAICIEIAQVESESVNSVAVGFRVSPPGPLCSLALEGAWINEQCPQG